VAGLPRPPLLNVKNRSSTGGARGDVTRLFSGSLTSQDVILSYPLPFSFVCPFTRKQSEPSMRMWRSGKRSLLFLPSFHRRLSSHSQRREPSTSALCPLIAPKKPFKLPGKRKVLTHPPTALGRSSRERGPSLFDDLFCLRPLTRQKRGF